jgi:hypothetical protein
MKNFIFTIATFLMGFVVLYVISIIVNKTVPPESTRKQPAPPVVHYTVDDLLDAIEWVESRGDANAIGDGGKAVGAYQIHKIYVDDCNRILKLNGESKRVTYDDRFDSYESRKITAYVTGYYANAVWGDKPHTPLQFMETAARIHNGGPTGYKKESTKAYWAKVKARMEGSK